MVPLSCRLRQLDPAYHPPVLQVSTFAGFYVRVQKVNNYWNYLRNPGMPLCKGTAVAGKAWQNKPGPYVR